MNSILQEFHFASADTVIKLMNIYATTLYGSNTWDIFSKDCEKLYSSFNIAIRQILRIDRCTHRYLIEPLSNCYHLKTVIASRYATFHKSLLSSVKKPVRFLARMNEFDLRTVLGKTLNKLALMTGLDGSYLAKLTASYVKKNMKYAQVPETECWRVPLCDELLGVQNGERWLEGFTLEEQDDLLRFVCIT